MFSVYDEVKNNVFNPGRHVFTRNGSYFGVIARPQRHTLPRNIGKWGSSDLYVAMGRGNVAALPSNLSTLLVPVHHGEMLPYAIQTTPTEMTLLTAYGNVSLCYAEPSLLLVKGENNVGLLFQTDMVLHQFLRRRKENSWEIPHSPVGSFVYTAVDGTISMDGKYDFQRLSHPIVRGEVVPNEAGEFLLAIEEFTHLGHTRQSYPGYAEGLTNAKADWDSYMSKMPAIPEYDSARYAAGYLTWSLLAKPSILVKRPQIYREFGQAASAWQSCQSAAAVGGNLPLALELILSQLDHQSPDGQIPDFSDDTRIFSQSAAAPAQGWALEYLMKKHDFAKEVPIETTDALYAGLSKWAEWYDAFRDDDGDGIPQYEGGEECGYEDCPVFEEYQTVELPDLCAFLALMEEKLGDLAGILGREEERTAWYDRSKARIDRMIRTFWTGKRFVGKVYGTGEILSDDSLVFYRPLILGDRLPAEIIDAMTTDLSEGKGYLTPYGLNSHKIESVIPDSLPVGGGRVLPAENALIATGLLWAGKAGQAADLADRYCRGIVDSSPFSPDRCFGDSWSATVFQILAELACDHKE